jgi:hypothetical protein
MSHGRTFGKKGGFTMGEQMHKRLSKEFVEGVLEAFNEHRIGEEKTCEILGVRRAQLYRLRKRWLRSVIGEKPFALYSRKESAFHRLPKEVEQWLHEEVTFIRQKAEVYRGRFNFAVLAEEAQKRFGRRFPRQTLRLFALRHGYYHGLPEEKKKLYVRFETPGPGFLFQHDSSKHQWVPALGGYQFLILTKDDYSRLFVGAHLIEREGSFEHLEVARRTVERYGRALAYYVDQHSIFRFVEHHGVHVRYLVGLDEGEIQFRRALHSLDIGLIYARKGAAAAKGKVEKAFDYLQRRVPYLCERYRIRGVCEAQKVVDEVVSFYNEQRKHEETGQVPLKRWQEALEAGKGRLRPLDPSVDLDLVFSLHYGRTVKKDGTFSFRGREFKLSHCGGERVTVCLIPDKKLMAVKDGQKVGEFHL